MAATLMITSKGVAGVPRASLVVILGIDQFRYGRSATNVIGNSLAAAVVAKFEKDLGPATDKPSDSGVPARAVA